ncbi:MAG: glycosyltransferase family 2 protein [Anaerolineales bacterium]|nr:glycosyltransferase family 2 protein [Anaerolineales bacterium]
MPLLLSALTILACAMLGAFAVRRVLFTATLLLRQPALPALAELPSVLLLVPARNEAASLPGLFSALSQLNYPPERLKVLLINDGSTDATGTLMAEAAERHSWQALHLPSNVGKPQALNTALKHQLWGELIYVFDADHRPQPNCLQEAVCAFGEPRVAGVSGRTVPSNALASPVAFYATLESMVHQLITIRGKDVLQLGPALLGSNNGYRRAALEQVGGFPAGVFLEDTELTLALYRAGWRVRYVPSAISHLQVPFTLDGFIKQRLRWSRGFNDAARTHLRALVSNPNLAWPMRAELMMFSVGYLDRLALLLAVGLLLVGAEPRGWLWVGITLSLGLPFVQIIATLAAQHVPLGFWLRLPLVPLFFALDIALAVWAMFLTLLNRPRVWTQTERITNHH